jgi:methyl-accepting chemotaxis protein
LSGGPPNPSRFLVAGLILVAVAVVLGLVLVQRVATTYRDGLDVAAESAALAADGTAPIVAITDELVDFAEVAERGIEDTRVLLATTQTSLEDLGTAATDDLAATTEGLGGLADRVAGVIESIERFVPGDRDSAAEDLRTIADGLEPVPDELRSLGVQLHETADQLGDLDPTLVEVAATVAALGDGREELAPSVSELAVTAQRVAERVDDARDRVDVDIWLARLVVVLIGAVLAIGLLLAAAAPDRGRALRADGVEPAVDVHDLTGGGREEVRQQRDA